MGGSFSDFERYVKRPAPEQSLRMANLIETQR